VIAGQPTPVEQEATVSSDVAVEVGEDAGGRIEAPGQGRAPSTTEEFFRRAARALERIADALEGLAASRRVASWRSRGGVLAEVLAEATMKRQRDSADRQVADSAPATFTVLEGGAAIQCNRCGRASRDPIDVRDKYCDGCHTFLSAASV
jgi:hypothetical protein